MWDRGSHLAVRPEAGDAEGGRDDKLLGLVIRRGATLEHLEALEGLSAAGRLVGEHSAHGAPEQLGGGAVVVGAVD